MSFSLKNIKRKPVCLGNFRFITDKTDIKNNTRAEICDTDDIKNAVALCANGEIICYIQGAEALFFKTLQSYKTEIYAVITDFENKTAEVYYIPEKL